MIRYKKHTIFVIENDYQYSKADILSLLKGDREVFEYLIESVYLCKNNRNYFAFKFIGVITIGNILICCFPKYYENNNLQNPNIISEFSEIIKILKEFGKTDYLPDSSICSTDLNINCSEIVLADKILKDYIQYGIFEKWEKIISLNSEGETNWDYTINLTDPIFSKKGPVYHDIYSSEIISENENLIREIHKWALNYSYNKYSTILDYLFWYDRDCVTCLQDLGTLDFLVTALKKELSISFTDRSISLLKILRYLVESVYYSSDNTFSIYGTGSFHVVWEYVCSWIFKNDKDNFKKFIPTPHWYSISGEKKTKHDTFNPDIITEELGNIYILDAKYYNLKLQENPFDISGNPGIGDVSKQFLYAEIFKKLSKPIYNCFLFPRIHNHFYVLSGYIKLELFESNIYNIFVSPQQLFTCYLKRKLIENLLKNLKSDIEQEEYVI